MDAFDLLNLEQVAIAIAASPAPMTDNDFEDAKRMVWQLIENFVCRDLGEFEVDGIEKEIVAGEGDEVLKCVVDVCGVMNSNIKPFNQFPNQRYVIDWKTSSKELDNAWRHRLIDSWQWRIYAYYERASLVIYRGVNRNLDTKELILVVPPSNDEEVEEYLRGGFAQRNALVNSQLKVWPRVMKHHACEAYGYKCENYVDCREYSMPREALPIRRMSYTQFENFYLCPERSRRMLLREDEGLSEASLLGKAVHRGMEEVYAQLFGRKNHSVQ